MRVRFAKLPGDAARERCYNAPPRDPTAAGKNLLPAGKVSPHEQADVTDESPPRILYCHCAYARVVPDAHKRRVLAELTSSGLPFEAVPDLCEMSARREARLQDLAGGGPLRIAACYPRAVRWLFAAAGAPLDGDGVEVLNMREELPADLTGTFLSARDLRRAAPLEMRPCPS